MIWLTREQPAPPGSVVLDNGLRSPMPVIVMGPPLWVYLLAGVLGVLVGAGIALAAFHVGGRTDPKWSKRRSQCALRPSGTSP